MKKRENFIVCVYCYSQVLCKHKKANLLGRKSCEIAKLNRLDIMKFDGLTRSLMFMCAAQSGAEIYGSRVRLIRLDVASARYSHHVSPTRDQLMSLQEFSATKNTRLHEEKNRKKNFLPSVPFILNERIECDLPYTVKYPELSVF